MICGIGSKKSPIRNRRIHYNDHHRLLTEAGPGFSHECTYNDNGDTLGKFDGADAIDYFYDFQNRLISVQTASSQVAYAYDADGIRVAKDTNGEITRYVIDSNRDYAQVLEETDGSGSLTVSYIYGDDLISQHRGGGGAYYHYDGQMSTRPLTVGDGSVTDTYVYDAFGVVIDQAGVTANNYLYAGEQYDPNAGFYYLRARYYNQSVGRFVTTDPWRGNQFEPVTLQKYSYANNVSMTFIDPSGQRSLSLLDISATIAISSILSSAAVTGFSHIASSEYGYAPIEWHGELAIGTMGQLPAAGMIIVTVESDCRRGRKGMGEYLIALAGVTLVSPPVLPGSYSMGKVIINTPGLFGTDPEMLKGPSSFISGTFAIRDGLSWTALYMGFGIGKFGIRPGVIEGLDIGFDIMGGWSFGLITIEDIPCPG